MSNIILLHIPHSSLKQTKEFKNIQKSISKQQLQSFNFTITDLYTDKLFSCRKFKYIRAKYSRICCDMEKFVDDSCEEMAKYGMGVIYNKTNVGETMICCSDAYKEQILKKYYYPYHEKLNHLVENSLAKNKPVILVDCHSFCKDIIMNGKTENLPEICIGSNLATKNDLQLLDFTSKFFTNLGYKTAINYPYFGSMIPNCLINKPTESFSSIMLEINKELYLQNFAKSKNFTKLKRDLFNFLTQLKTLVF